MDQLGALAVLRRVVATYRTQREAAEALGISQSYLTDLLHGRRPIAGKILRPLGLMREVTIVKTKAS